jgi:hypothetical protein
MFLPHYITVSRANKSIVRWSVVNSYDIILDRTPAMIFKKSNQNLPDTDLGINTEKDSYEVIIQNTNIQVWDLCIIELTPTFTQSNYVVESVDYNYSKISWSVDNVYFTIKRQYG